MIDGLRVIADEPVVTALPHPPDRPPVCLKGFTRLTLEDQTVLYACSECDFTGERGEILRHRAAKHGTAMGGRRKGVDYPAKDDRRRRDDTLTAAMALSIGEVIELAADINNYGTLISTLTAERDDLRDRLVAVEQEVRKYRLAFERLGFVSREVTE